MNPKRCDALRPRVWPVGEPVRYTSAEEDSARWLDFPVRDGDIVISTRSKCGTTWMQQICLSLVLGSPKLPDTLSRLSPWIDWLVEPYDEMLTRLERQDHRRVLKTHTPLDGVVLDQRATYLVVGRHPLDMGVSLYHQGNNLDRKRIEELTGAPPPEARTPLKEWLLRWIEREAAPQRSLDSLPGVMWHLSDAWTRRYEPNVHLVHYADLITDLAGEMCRVADLLGVVVDEHSRPSLVQAATFASMRARAADLVPNTGGVLKDPAAFYRHGTTGDGAALLTREELARYQTRAAELAPGDLLRWLHR